MKITDATPEEASLIAEAIMAAIGPEICQGIAGETHSLADVKTLFTRLAAREDSQYSRLNTRVARTDDGTPMGACVSYDGALLRPLRRSFFQEANQLLGWAMTPEEIEKVPEETSADEYYLDTLMVLPQYRGQGVARALIADAAQKAKSARKPLGLLCEANNAPAYRLYTTTGFREIGNRPFAGVQMRHLRLG